MDVLVNSSKRWQCCKDSFRTIDYRNPLPNLGVLHWKCITEFQCIYSPTYITHLRGPARFSSTEYVRQVFISRGMHILYFHNILQCQNQKSNLSVQPSTSCLAPLQIFLGRKVYISCHNCDLIFLAGSGCAMFQILMGFPNFKHDFNLICFIWTLYIG